MGRIKDLEQELDDDQTWQEQEDYEFDEYNDQLDVPFDPFGS